MTPPPRKKKQKQQQQRKCQVTNLEKIFARHKVNKGQCLDIKKSSIRKDSSLEKKVKVINRHFTWEEKLSSQLMKRYSTLFVIRDMPT